MDQPVEQPNFRLFREVSSRAQSSFLIRLRIENIKRIRLASILGLVMAGALLCLDFLRYSEGRFSKSYLYLYLFLTHASLLILIVPVFVISFNKGTISIGRYKYSYSLIASWTIYVSLSTLTMAILSIIERGSIAMYAINLLVVNFVVIMLHFDRILLNILSYLIIFCAIVLIQESHLEMMMVNILEATGVSILAFAVSTNLFNNAVSDFNYERTLRDKNVIIEKERETSHDLLLNILPAAIAEELILNKKVQPKDYSSATVMMLDFQEFSKKSNLVTPAELVTKIDYCFSAFDEILPKFGLEKIKTLGDGYLCVGGVPTPTTDHPVQVINAALEILAFLEEWKNECILKNEIYFEGRVGIHTGPLIAGVVGKSKFAFDIWGDTVNIAARMESSGAVGRINISKSTYQLVETRFDFAYRGKIPIKNQEPIDMYFLVAAK